VSAAERIDPTAFHDVEQAGLERAAARDAEAFGNLSADDRCAARCVTRTPRGRLA